MTHLGYEAHQLHILNKDETYGHITAVVKIKNKYMVVDTSHHFFFATDKEPIGIYEMRNFPEYFSNYNKIIKERRNKAGFKITEFTPESFENGIFFDTFPYIKDKKKLFKKIFEKIRNKIS